MAQLAVCPWCGRQKWAYLGGDRSVEPPCGTCVANRSTFTCIEGRHRDCGGRTVTGPCFCTCHPTPEASLSARTEEP